MTRVRIRQIAPDVYIGSLTLDSPDCGGVGDTGGDGVITVGAFGASKADALHKTALLAERIINDPVMSMILPPQARAAVMATKKLGAAAKRGSRFFRKLWKSYSGPGTKRIAKALHDEALKREGLSDAEVGAFWDTVKKVAKKAAKYSAPGLIYRGAKAVKKKMTKKKPRVKVIEPRDVPPEVPQYDEEAPQYDEPDGADTAPGGVEVTQEPQYEEPQYEDAPDNGEEEQAQ